MKSHNSEVPWTCFVPTAFTAINVHLQHFLDTINERNSIISKNGWVGEVPHDVKIKPVVSKASKVIHQTVD